MLTTTAVQFAGLTAGVSLEFGVYHKHCVFPRKKMFHLGIPQCSGSDSFAKCFKLAIPTCTCGNSFLLLFPSLQVGRGQGPLNPTYDIIFPL